MAMDVESIKKMLAGMGRKGKGGTTRAWKPKDEHDVRVLPLPDGEEPFKTVSQHKLDQQTVVNCPGDGCPICEFAEKLRAWKDEDGKDKPEAVRKKEFQTFRQLQAVTRVFLPVVERSKESEGAKWWSCTENTFAQAMKPCTDSDWNKVHPIGGTAVITDTKVGLDLHISFKKPNEKGNTKNITVIDVTERKIMTPLSNDPGEVKRFIESIPDFSTVEQPATIDEARTALMKFVGGASPEAPVGGSGKEYAKPAEGEKPADEKPVDEKSEKKGVNAEKLVGKKTIDEAFDDFLKPDEKSEKKS